MFFEFDAVEPLAIRVFESVLADLQDQPDFRLVAVFVDRFVRQMELLATKRNRCRALIDGAQDVIVENFDVGDVADFFENFFFRRNFVLRFYIWQMVAKG